MNFETTCTHLHPTMHTKASSLHRTPSIFTDFIRYRVKTPSVAKHTITHEFYVLVTFMMIDAEAFGLVVCDSQDPYFDMTLVGACLQLAAPHLEVCPTIFKHLERIEYFKLSSKIVDSVHKRAKRILFACRSGVIPARCKPWSQLRKLAAEAPWLFELNAMVLENDDHCPHMFSSNEKYRMATDCIEACEAWGTPWSRIASVQETMSSIVRIRALLNDKYA